MLVNESYQVRTLRICGVIWTSQGKVRSLYNFAHSEEYLQGRVQTPLRRRVRRAIAPNYRPLRQHFLRASPGRLCQEYDTIGQCDQGPQRCDVKEVQRMRPKKPGDFCESSHAQCKSWADLFSRKVDGEPVESKNNKKFNEKVGQGGSPLIL